MLFLSHIRHLPHVNDSRANILQMAQTEQNSSWSHSYGLYGYGICLATKDLCSTQSLALKHVCNCPFSSNHNDFGGTH